jgi:Concanavalin A-like lectin/glucanases superfamily/PEP-CTERM motif
MMLIIGLACLAGTIAQADPIPVSAWLGDGDATDAYGDVHGTLTGDTSYVAGQFGQAFSFDGAGDGVLLDDNAFDSLGSGNITIMAWMMTEQGGAYADDFTPVRFESGWMIYFDYGKPGVPAAVWDGHWSSLLTSGWEADIRGAEWHHITTVYDGGTARIYVDGVEKGSGQRSLQTDGSINAFGSTGHFHDYHGLLDEVAIFDTALSQSEIQDIMNNGLGSTPVPEPATMTVLGLGLVGLAAPRVRRRKG